MGTQLSCGCVVTRHPLLWTEPIERTAPNLNLPRRTERLPQLVLNVARFAAPPHSHQPTATPANPARLPWWLHRCQFAPTVAAERSLPPPHAAAVLPAPHLASAEELPTAPAANLWANCCCPEGSCSGGQQWLGPNHPCNGHAGTLDPGARARPPTRQRDRARTGKPLAHSLPPPLLRLVYV